jgi:hypothetical protein
VRVLAIGCAILGVNAILLPATPAAQMSQATVGAQAPAFASKFGQPVKDFGPAKFYVVCDGSESGTKWGITFKGDKATEIERSACGAEHLDAATTAKEATAMMPSDAKPVREFSASDGRLAHEFRSLSLANAFPAGDFVGCDAEGRSQKVAEGTLSYATATDGRSWMIILGTCF